MFQSDQNIASFRGGSYHVRVGLERGQISRGQPRLLLKRLLAADILDLDQPLRAVLQDNAEIGRTAGIRGMYAANILCL